MGRLTVGARRRRWPPRAGDGGTKHPASVLFARSAAKRPPGQARRKGSCGEKEQQHSCFSPQQGSLREKRTTTQFPAPQRDRLRRNREKWHAEKSVPGGRVSGDYNNSLNQIVARMRLKSEPKPSRKCIYCQKRWVQNVHVHLPIVQSSGTHRSAAAAFCIRGRNSPYVQQQKVALF